MRKPQILQHDVLHRLGFRGFKTHQLRQTRSHDRHGLRCLARQRQIGQHPGRAVEIPFARLGKRLADIRQVKPRELPPLVAEAPQRLRMEMHDAPFLLQLFDPVMRVKPELIRDEIHVPKIAELLETPLRILCPVRPLVPGGPAIREPVESGETVKPFPRQPRTPAPLSVHPQLREKPRTLAHFRKFQCPGRPPVLRPHLPAGEPPTTAQLRSRPRSRRPPLAIVGRGKNQRTIQFVNTIVDDDLHRPADFPRLALGAMRCGKWTFR